MSQCTRTIEINGVELEVVFDYTPADPENGVAEDMEIEEVNVVFIGMSVDIFPLISKDAPLIQQIYAELEKSR